MASLFSKGVDDFLVALGCGEISPHQIAVKLAAPEEPPQPPPLATPSQPVVSSAVQVLGVGDLLTHLAACCHPVPGDQIIGFITRSRGVTVHRKDCPNIAHEDERERLVRVDWVRGGSSYPVSILIEALDRVGLFRDISTVVSAEKVNMTRLSSVEHGDGTTSIHITLEVNNVNQLGRLFSRLEKVHEVTSVSRTLDGVKQGE